MRLLQGYVHGTNIYLQHQYRYSYGMRVYVMINMHKELLKRSCMVANLFHKRIQEGKQIEAPKGVPKD